MKKNLIAALVLCITFISAQIPTANLLGYYPFSGNANDASGNAYNGTVSGASLTTDRFGNSNSAYSFNGSANYISLPSTPYIGLNSYSYSFWMKPTSYPSSGGMAFCLGENGPYCQALTYQSAGNVFAGGYNIGGNPTQSYSQSAPMSINQWIHVTVTRDFTNIKLYVNGILNSVQSTANTNGQPADYGSISPSRAFIGGRTNFTAYFTGSIDDVRIYSVVLNSADVTALYNESCIISQTPSTLICEGGSATFTANVTGTASISWYASSTSTTVIGSGTLFSTPSLSSAGIYTYYTAASSCTNNSRLPLTVTVNPTPALSVNSGSICSGNSFLIVPSGASTYTYSGGSNLVAPASSTSYSVTGTNSFGCTSTLAAVANVTVFASPTVSVNSSFVCSGSSYTLNPSGATSYTYSGGSQVVTPLINTSYTVTGSNGNGCYSSAVANIAVVATPSLVVSNPGNVCIGNSVTLAVSGANFYTWDSGATTSSITVSPSVTTNYTVTGVNFFGCLSTSVVAVNVNPYPVISVNSGSVCLGSSFTLLPSGAATYTFSGGSSLVSPAVNTSYSVTGTSAQGCVASNTAVAAVTVMTLPVISVSSGTTCSGNSFTISPSGGVSYTYTGGSSVVFPATTSSYLVTGSGANGCTSTATSTVTVNSLPSVNITGLNSICAGDATSFTAIGASSYTWNTGATSAVISASPLSTLTYSVFGQDANGCSNSATKLLTVNALPFITVNSGTVCSGNAFLLVPAGASTYTYSSGSNSVSPSGNTNYSVTGTSAQGCISSNTAVSSVSVLALPFVSVNSGSICSGNNFVISPSGAISYTYSGGSSNVSPLLTTTYSVTGSNAFGCISAPAISSVTVAALPVVSVNSGSVCSGTSFTINPSGAVTYTLSSGSNIVAPNLTTNYTVTGTSPEGCTSNPAISTVTVYALPLISVNSGSICSGNTFTIIPSGAATYVYSSGSNTVTPTADASYTVTGQSAEGCPSSNSAVSSVTVMSLPLVSVNNGTVCAGDIFTLIASGASSYSYSGGSSTVIPLSSGSFTVKGISAAGCLSSNTGTANVVVNSLPVLSVTGPFTICAGSASVISAQGALSYTWTTGVLTNSTLISPVLPVTSYTVYGTDVNGCIGKSVPSISLQPLPIVTVNSGAICIGNSFTLSPSGAQTYSYSNGSGIITPVITSTYAVYGTSAFGCLSAAPAISTVTVNSLPNIVISGTNTLCEGETIILTVSGGNSYLWNTNASFSTLTITPLTTTAYTVTGTDLNSCVNTATQLVTVNPLPTLTVSSGAICPGNSFTLNPSGANSYTISGGATIVSPSSTSSYTITGTNAQGCVSPLAAIATVSVINTLTVTVSGTSSICAGQSANLTANGASTYSWNTGVQTNTVSLSPAVNTSYTVTGMSGTCSDSFVVTVSVNPLPLVTVNSGTVCEGTSFVMNPSGALSYTFSGGSATVTPVASGTYAVIGIDLNSCFSQVAISNVSVNALPSINAVSSAPFSICDGEQATLTAMGAINYTWTPGSTTNPMVITPSVNTQYTVTGEDQNGCRSFITVIQNVDACTNVSELNGINTTGFSVYPNPTRGHFSITYNLPASTTGKLIVEDLQGKPLFVYLLNSLENSFEVRDLAVKPGIYFCRLQVNEKNTAVKKVIITN